MHELAWVHRKENGVRWLVEKVNVYHEDLILGISEFDKFYAFESENQEYSTSGFRSLIVYTVPQS